MFQLLSQGRSKSEVLVRHWEATGGLAKAVRVKRYGRLGIRESLTHKAVALILGFNLRLFKNPPSIHVDDKLS